MAKFTSRYTPFKKSAAGNSYQPKPGTSKAKQHLDALKRAAKDKSKYTY